MVTTNDFFKMQIDECIFNFFIFFLRSNGILGTEHLKRGILPYQLEIESLLHESAGPKTNLPASNKHTCEPTSIGCLLTVRIESCLYCQKITCGDMLVRM